MACAPNGVVYWADLRELMDQTMDLRGFLQLTDSDVYDPRTDTSSPFYQAAAVPASFAYKFFLKNLTTPVVDRHFAVKKLCDTSQMAWPDGLQDLAAAGRLSFVKEGDKCQCCTVFDVFDGAGISLREPAETARKGCYQTLYVPQAGDPLDYDQNIIPAAYVWYYLTPKAWPSSCFYGPRCDAEVDKTDHNKAVLLCAYSMVGDKTESQLGSAARWMEGYFTWKILGGDLEAIWDALYEILNKSCGATAWKFYKDGDASEYVGENCPVTMEDILWTLKQEGNTLSENPGGIADVSNLPWWTATSGAENCEDKGLKVYCNTLQHLKAIIDKMYDLQPRTDGKCPGRVYVIQVCNENSAKDDNFAFSVNGSNIGNLDLNHDDQVGSVFIFHPTASIDPAQADFPCPMSKMVQYRADPSILQASNTWHMRNTQRNENGNYGTVQIRSYSVGADGSLGCPQFISDGTYSGADGADFDGSFILPDLADPPP